MSDASDPAGNIESDFVLKEDRVIATVGKLRQRIHERFPNAGLAVLCSHLQNVAKQAAQRSAWIESRILWIRVVGLFLAVAIIGIMIALAVAAFHSGADQDQNLSFTEFIAAFESGVNETIFIGAAIFFLFSVETRIKRRRALAAIHELRSIAHIIDMHQLTKDPERVLGIGQPTENSPKMTMTPFELNRYLDYCTEMLSLTGKIAAIYVRKFDDPVAVAAVSEVEQLSTGLSRKIWQKIMILKQYASESAMNENDRATSRSQESNAEPEATDPDA